MNTAKNEDFIWLKLGKFYLVGGGTFIGEGIKIWCGQVYQGLGTFQGERGMNIFSASG